MNEDPQLLWIGVLLGSLVLASSISGGESREQLLETALDGNRAAILSIRSMECRYERRPWANTTPEQADKYFANFSPGWFWRSGEVYRLLKPMADGNTLDYVIYNGKGHFLRKGGPLTRPNLTFAALRPVDGVGGDMWQWLLISHWGRTPPGFYLLDEILEHPYVIRTAERIAPPSNDIHIELKLSGNRQLELWFDSKVNYLVRKKISIPPEPSYRWEDEVIEFSEAATAVFVPIVIEHRCFIKGMLQAVIRTTLLDLKVNQPLDKNALRIPGIAGTDCVDMDRDVKYKVDADGNRIGPEIAIPVAHISPPSRPGGGGFLPWGTSHSLPEPSQPPTPVWMWVLMVSVVVLASGVVLAIIRRRKHAPTS